MKLRMICSAALVLFVLVFCCACQYAFSIPEQGEYYCAEYNATLHFESNGTYVMVANDEKIGLYIDYGNNVFSTDYTLKGRMHWDERKDTIELEIEQGNAKLQKGVYVFEKKQTS